MALYEEMGGAPACRQLAVAFYTRVGRDPLLRPFFPGKTFTCAIEQFTAFLIQFLGGPPEETQRRQYLSLRDSHGRFRIGERERDAWLALMAKALDDVPIPEPARAALQGFFERSSAHIIGSEAPGPIDEEMAGRWQVQVSLDEAVAAVRSGDVDRALALADPACGALRFAGLLATMIDSGDSVLLGYVGARVAADPALAHERYAGWTLLHRAAAAGNTEMVEMLLRLGADPNARDGGGHTPLYSVGNECRVEGGAQVVRALVQAGASVDAADGVKRTTPLHMAARRGNVEVAQALLDCGASIEACDSAGETPLRRAVNCDKVEVARLLLERGADPDSPGSKRLTPRLAARSDSMKQLLQSVSRAHTREL
jgi:truncated hemoglobin YjbI